MNNYEYFLAQEAKIKKQNKKFEREYKVINSSIEHNKSVNHQHEQFMQGVNSNTFHEQLHLFMS